MSCENKICSICLSSYSDKTAGRPDTCNHLFCLECILRWAKTSNLCPVDRAPFKNVNISYSGSVLGRVNVKSKKGKKVQERYDFSTQCEVCKNRKEGGILLLCDACDLGFHLACLDPPLLHVPVGNWYCETCRPIISGGRKRGRKRTAGNLLGRTVEVKADNFEPKKQIASKDACVASSSSDKKVGSTFKDLDAPICMKDLKGNVRISSDGSLLFNATNLHSAAKTEDLTEFSEKADVSSSEEESWETNDESDDVCSSKTVQAEPSLVVNPPKDSGHCSSPNKEDVCYDNMKIRFKSDGIYLVQD